MLLHLGRVPEQRYIIPNTPGYVPLVTDRLIVYKIDAGEMAKFSSGMQIQLQCCCS